MCECYADDVRRDIAAQEEQERQTAEQALRKLIADVQAALELATETPGTVIAVCMVL